MRRSKMRRRVVLATLVAALLVPAHAWAATPTDGDTVSVAASGTVLLKPDVATISFGVRRLDRSPTQALSKLTDKTNGVVAALEQAGVAQADITVGDVSLSKRVGRHGKFLGYSASASVKVETSAVDTVGDLVSIGVAGGANSIRDVQFDVKDKTAAVEQALQQAMGFARDKATVLAQSAGRQLGQAIEISEGNTQSPRAVHASPVFGKSLSGGSGAPQPQPFPITPPTLHATATIHVTFQLI